MTPAELLHFAATHDYSKVNETMRVIMDAATEIERLRKAAKEAAQLLRDEAENLKQAHTIGGVWDTSCEGEVIAHYESVMELVERLDSSNAVTTVRLNGPWQSEEQAMTRVCGRFHLVPI